MSKNQILDHSISSIAMNFIKLTTGLIIGIILAKGLMPEGRGEYAIVTVIPTTVAMLGSIGIYASCNYFISKNEYSITEIFSNVLLINLIISILLVVISTLLSEKVLSLFNFTPSNSTIYILAVSLIPTIIFYSSLLGILYGSRNIVFVNIWESISIIIQMIMLFLSIYVLKLGINGAIIVFALVRIVDVLIYTFFVFHLGVKIIKPSIEIINKVIGYGFKVHIGRSVQFLNYRFDIYLVSIFLGMTTLGYYSVAVSLAQVLWILPNSIGMIMVPNIAKLDIKDRAIITAKICRTTILLSVITAFFYSGLGSIVIYEIYGKAYTPSIIPFLLLIPGVVFLTLFKIIAPFFQATNLPIIPSIASIIGLLIGIPLNLLLIPRFGLLGVAFSSTITYGFQSIFITFRFKQYSKLRYANILILSVSDIRKIVREGFIRIQSAWNYSKTVITSQ